MSLDDLALLHPTQCPLGKRASSSVDVTTNSELSHDSSYTQCKISKPTHFPVPSYPGSRIRKRDRFAAFVRSIFDQSQDEGVGKEKLTRERYARSLVSQVLSSYYSRPSEGDAKMRVRVLESLQSAFSEANHDTVNELRQGEAQLALDIMQEVLSGMALDNHRLALGASPADVDEARWLLRRRLQRLSCNSNLLPSPFYVTGVAPPTGKTVGSGRFADVYRRTYRGRDVAIKHLRVFKMVQPSQELRIKEAFYREAILWFNLRHKHIVPFLGVVRDEDSGMSMVLEWAENGSLSHYLDRPAAKGIARHFGQWLLEIALGLEYLHAMGIVHGDLRGTNILVTKQGYIQLADFGLSVIGEVGVSCTNSGRGGSVAWTAPELISPKNESPRPTFATDMYSFGCVCVELYSGQNPFPGLKEPQIIKKVLSHHRPARPTLPGQEICDELWDFIQLCWKKRPHKRPSATRAVGVLSKVFRK